MVQFLEVPDYTTLEVYGDKSIVKRYAYVQYIYVSVSYMVSCLYVFHM